MITTHSLTDKMAGKALGCFVEGYRPDRQGKMIVYSFPLAVFIFSGFLTLHQPMAKSQNPGVEQLMLVLSKMGSVETEAPAEVALLPNPDPVPPIRDSIPSAAFTNTPVEAVPPEPVEPQKVVDAALEPAPPEPVEKPAVVEVPVELAPEPVAVESVAVQPRPAAKPEIEPEPETVTAGVQAPEPVEEAPVLQAAQMQEESAPAANQVAELQMNTIASDIDPSIPIFIEDPEFLSPPSPPAYPPMSVKRREQGTVVVRALISGAGAAREVQVWQSSGFRRLDQAAQVAVKDWQFAPAFRMGIPVAAWVEVPVHFQLN